MSLIRVAITDDHDVVCQGIKAMLADLNQIQLVGIYSNASETLQGLSNTPLDILLLDINLPDQSGIELAPTLLKDYPDLHIIALSGLDDLSFVKKMMRQGAKGYLLKNTGQAELINAIQTVMQGQSYIQRSLEKSLLSQALGEVKVDPFAITLTRREKEVLHAMADELTTKEISERLCISPKTVETHRMNLMSKLGAKNSVGIIKKAMERGLL